MKIYWSCVDESGHPCLAVWGVDKKRKAMSTTWLRQSVNAIFFPFFIYFLPCGCKNTSFKNSADRVYIFFCVLELVGFYCYIRIRQTPIIAIQSENCVYCCIYVYIMPVADSFSCWLVLTVNGRHLSKTVVKAYSSRLPWLYGS